ncbi:hypothetical protein D3C81_1886590 [compost metagenome]
MLAGKSPDITEETADKSKPKLEMIETSNLVTEVSKHHSTKKWIRLFMLEKLMRMNISLGDL